MEHAKIIEGNVTHAVILPRGIKNTSRNDIMDVSFGIIPGHRPDWCRTTVGGFSSIFLKGQGDNHTISDAFSAIIRPLAPVFFAI
jgi:hypothetical protein